MQILMKYIFWMLIAEIFHQHSPDLFWTSYIAYASQTYKKLKIIRIIFKANNNTDIHLFNNWILIILIFSVFNVSESVPRRSKYLFM